MESDLNTIPTAANRSVICTSHLDRSSVSSRNSRRTPHLIAPTSRPQALLSPASRLLGPPPTFTSRTSMSVPPFHTQASPPRSRRSKNLGPPEATSRTNSFLAYQGVSFLGFCSTQLPRRPGEVVEQWPTNHQIQTPSPVLNAIKDPDQ